MSLRPLAYLLLPLAVAAVASGCSSASYKTQEYAKLSNTKDFEEEYPLVWKATIAALGEYKLEDKDQEKGRIVSDWVYSTSNDKFLELQVNGFPRKKYLQTRYKYRISLDREFGKVKATVDLDEEIEALKSDGSHDGWSSVSDIDTQRANDMLKSIEMKILSFPEALKK